MAAVGQNADEPADQACDPEGDEDPTKEAWHVNEHEEQRDRSSYWQGEPSPRENAVHRRDASRLGQCSRMSPELGAEIYSLALAKSASAASKAATILSRLGLRVSPLGRRSYHGIQ